MLADLSHGSPCDFIDCTLTATPACSREVCTFLAMFFSVCEAMSIMSCSETHAGSNWATDLASSEGQDER